MKVLLVGGGGREHALAWRIRKDSPGVDLIAAPGNPGIATLARCVKVGASDVDGLLRLAREGSVDLTIVGPVGPLAAGNVEQFRGADEPHRAFLNQVKQAQVRCVPRCTAGLA